MRPSFPKLVLVLLATAVVSAPGATARAQTAGPANAPAQTAPAQAGQPQAAESTAPPGAGQTTGTAAAAPAEQKAATGTAGTEKTSAAAAADEGMTEDEVAQMLVGKLLFLRGGYLEDRLSFDSSGNFTGNSPRGSYTLCGVKIEKVHLTKHRLELTGQRYGLHFLGVLAYENTGSAYDAVRLTTGKKDLEITVDRDSIEEPKKFGFLDFRPGPEAKATGASKPAAGKPGSAAPAQGVGQVPPTATTAATPETPAQADQALKAALGRIFAIGIDSKLIAAMPGFWQLYYKAAEEKADYRPMDPAVLRDDAVDQKARLLTIYTPESNGYAQAHGVSGMALFQVVVGTDGKAGEIAVARPIGFGLDENAVAAIRKASFQPAIKDGRAVPVLVNMDVEFRIYSGRTVAGGKPETVSPVAQPAGPVLPGPYSVPHP